MQASDNQYLLKVQAWFSGHVQGVGFRYQTLQIAKEFQVTGTVANLSDGRVHLNAEGDTQEVRAFLAEIQNQLSNYIKKTETSEDQGSRQFEGFQIIYPQP